MCIIENWMSQSEGVMVMCVRGFVYMCVKEVFYDEFVGSWWLMQHSALSACPMPPHPRGIMGKALIDCLWTVLTT